MIRATRQPQELQWRVKNRWNKGLLEPWQRQKNYTPVELSKNFNE